MRRANDANSLAKASAPIVVNPIETSVIGPYGASDEGRLKIPTPTMLPTTSAVAPTSVRRSSGLEASSEGVEAGAGSVIAGGGLPAGMDGFAYVITRSSGPGWGAG